MFFIKVNLCIIFAKGGSIQLLNATKGLEKKYISFGKWRNKITELFLISPSYSCCVWYFENRILQSLLICWKEINLAILFSHTVGRYCNVLSLQFFSSFIVSDLKISFSLFSLSFSLWNYIWKWLNTLEQIINTQNTFFWQRFDILVKQ